MRALLVMEKTVWIRVAFLAGFLALSQCEDERAIRIKVGGTEVYRGAAYVDRSVVDLECVAPKESKDEVYNDLAIYQGNVTKDSKALCKGSPRTECFLDPNKGTLTLRVTSDKGGLYTCQYEKAPEPPVKPATVNIFFKVPGNDMKVFGEDGRQITDELQISNETSFRLLCPGTPEEGSKVRWFRNEHELKFDHGNAHFELNDTNQNLTFKKFKTMDKLAALGGYYRCERVSKDGKSLGGAFVKVNSHANVIAAQKSYNKMESESVTMSCEVQGEPVPQVSWRRDGKLLGPPGSDDEKRITFSSHEGIPGASITINNLVAEDYGEYFCVAKSSDGSVAEYPTLLRVRSKLAALWPFLGIVAEVIILVAVIFIYEKRRAKKEQEENEDAADQKKSLTASNNENKDVRQRKA